MQFANRFVYLDASKATKVDDHDLCKELGTAQYRRCLTNACGRYLMERLNYYKSLGRLQAQLQAKRDLELFHQHYGIANTFGTLDDSFVERADEFRCWLQARKWDAMHEAPGGDGWIIQRASSAFDSWLAKAEFAPSEKATLGPKRNDIFNLVCEGGAKQRKTKAGKNIGGALFVPHATEVKP